MNDRAATCLAFVVFAILGAGAYGNVVSDGAFLMDDHDYILRNPAVQDLTVMLRTVWEPRYVGFLSFALNHHISGTAAVPFHVTNVLIHVCAACVAFLLTRQILARSAPAPTGGGRQALLTSWLPLLVGLLFLLHPVETQAVSYVSQRFTSLSSLFYMAACLCYISFRERVERDLGPFDGVGLYAGSILFALLAVKTKETAFSLPALLLFAEATLFTTSRIGLNRVVYVFPHVAIVTLIPLSLFAFDLGLATNTDGLLVSMVEAKQDDLLTLSPYLYFINQLRVVALYVRLLVLPVGQRAQYDFEASGSLMDPRVLGGVALLMGLASVGIWMLRKSRQTAGTDRGLLLLGGFGIGWFFVALSVESSFIPIKHLIFEQRAYLPSLGFFMAASAVTALVGRRLPGWIPRPALGILAAGMIVALGAATHQRNTVWTDPILLWTDVIEKSPGLLAGWHNRAVEYRDRGQYERAMADLDQGVRHFHESFRRRTAWLDPDLNPENAAKVFGVRAKIALITGDVEKATQDFRQVAALARISRSPPFVVAVMTDIAAQFESMGFLREAIDQFGLILEVSPGDVTVRQRRASALLNANFPQQARAELDVVLRIDPGEAPAYLLRAAALERLGLAHEAERDRVHACDLGFAPACRELGRPERIPPGGQKPVWPHPGIFPPEGHPRGPGGIDRGVP